MTSGIRIALLACATGAAPAAAQCSDWRAGPLTGMPFEGVDDDVYAAMSWDPDGAGPADPVLAVGGSFLTAGGRSARRIATWDGYYWRALDSGVLGNGSERIEALGVHNGLLVAGGAFTSAGGTPASMIASWNGSSWQPYGAGFNSTVKDVAVYNGELVAGGYFSQSGATMVGHLARWNGSSWQPFGPGVPYSINALTVYNGSLIAAGWESLGVAPVVRWNGSTWQPLGSGMVYLPATQGSRVEDLMVYNGELIACGEFTSAGGVAASHIARWNGSVWQPLGSGITGGVGGNPFPFVYSLAVSGSELIVGGYFSAAGGVTARSMARWNGAQWQPIPSLPTPSSLIHAVTLHDGGLFAGGYFQGDSDPENIARLDGAQWVSLRESPEVDAFATLGDRIVAAGTFFEPTSGELARRIAAWGGVEVTPLGLGFTGEVRALESFAHLTPPFETELVAGGFFTASGSVTVNHVARWIDSPVALPPPEWEPMGPGFNDGVLALERFNSGTYAGGHFTVSGSTLTNHIARWDEPTGGWKPVGTGINGPVRALRTGASFPGVIELLAGGNFSAAGGVPAANIARWAVNPVVPGSGSWSALGAGFNGVVNDIERHEGSTYAAGSFTMSGVTPVSRIARWTGSAWVDVGGGFTGGPVHALKSHAGMLYAAGDFFTAGGVNAERVARWDGVEWTPVHGGAQGPVWALHSFKGEVHAGGEFGTVRNGNVESPGWARFLADGAVWIAHQPASAVRPCGANFAPDLQVASGYGGLSYQWRKNGVPLVSGPTGTGSTIVGANGNFAIGGVGLPDEGDYDCVVTNCGGSVVSATATLTVTGCCYANCTGGGGLTVADFGCFQTQFVAGNSYADCNGDGALTVADFGCFQTRFVAGCP